MFMCPKCELKFEGRLWDEKTKEVFGEPITKISNDLYSFCAYVCPSCSYISTKKEITEAGIICDQ